MILALQEKKTAAGVSSSERPDCERDSAKPSRPTCVCVSAAFFKARGAINPQVTPCTLRRA